MDPKYLAMAIFFIMAIAGIFLVISYSTVVRAEQGPAYKVIRKDDKIEVRDYQDYITADVDIISDHDRAVDSGFMKLFNYISGKNSNRSKISMTTPVFSEKVGESTYRVSFVMPSDLTMGTLPAPDDKNITIRKVDAHKVATIRFSGRMSESLAENKISELKAWMDKNGLAPLSNYRMAQYDPPWIPGFLRRNEVMVEI